MELCVDAKTSGVKYSVFYAMSVLAKEDPKYKTVVCKDFYVETTNQFNG
jgi:hypothetical protein